MYFLFLETINSYATQPIDKKFITKVGKMKVLFGLIKSGVETFVSVSGALWLVCELIQVILEKEASPISVKTILLISLVSGLGHATWFCYKCLFRSHTILEGNIRIKVRIGDISKVKKCSILVGTNDTCNYNLKEIGPNSIQAQIQKKRPKLLYKIKGEFDKKRGKIMEYGSVIQVKSGNQQCFHFLVMSTLKSGHNVNTSKSELIHAINRYFFQVKDLEIINGTLAVPLIGTGAAGVLMSKQEVAQILAQSFIVCQKNECTNVKEMIIQISWRDLKNIDLIALNDVICWMTKQCNICLYK